MENDLFLQQAKLSAEGCCIYDDLRVTKTLF